MFMQRQITTSDRRRQAGFTLIEVLLVVAIGTVLTAITIFGFQASQRQIWGDSNMRLLSSQLQTARELAVSQRRYIEVKFVGVNEIDTVRHEIPNGQTLLTRVFLENNARFLTFPGVPDTPDGFGNTDAVDFGAATSHSFGPDGMFVDETGTPVNGSVFLGVLGRTESARAVTVLGSTGRVRSYRWNGAVWGG